LEYRWTYTPANQQKVQILYEALKVNKVICELLIKRGITTFDEAKNFFRPSLSHLHNPFLLKDMKAAIERLNAAIQAEERIMIYGDYDVDGTTSVALVYGFLKEHYPNLIYYIPDRYKEGYGVSYQSIDFAQKEGISLIIALDCGIKAIEKIDYAAEKGIDYIICDHHRPGDNLPKAVAVLDAKRTDNTYPYDDLCGCGVGFKLLQAFCQTNDIPFSKLENYIDLVMVAIASDIVPITGENRTIAYYGLQKLNNQPRPGLEALLNVSQMEGKALSITDVVFTIGPRINAAGRLESGNKAVSLLLAEGAEAAMQATYIDKNNQTRRNIDKSMTQEAIAMIAENSVEINKKTTVLYQPHWHKGVIGIVASRVMETYYRPTIILTQSNGKVAGSARSVRGFDVYEAINACSDCLIQFGGHKYAAGLTMQEEMIPAFIQKFEQVVQSTIPPDLLIPEIKIDAELPLNKITDKFYNIIQQMAPFGPSNMRPVFIAKGVEDTGWSKTVGATNSHLKLSVKQNGSQNFSGIAFNLGHKLPIVQNGLFDICYQLDINEWQGKKSLQLKVKDVREHEKS